MPDEGALDKRLQRLRRRKSRWALARTMVITAGVVDLLFGVIFGIAVVQGDSMIPALRESDVALFLRIGNTYHIGDIALVEAGDGTEYVKRIVALPGQTVAIDDETGELLVDGEPLLEPYIYEGTYSKTGIGYPITLGEDEYFVLGDHRENSKDSRNYGPVSAKQLDGKLLFFFRWQK